MREILVDADAAYSRSVERGDSGCAAVGLHAVDQHRPAHPAQLPESAHGVEQHEVQVGVDTGLIDKAHINLFGAGWQVGVANTAERHNRVDTVGQ